MKNQFIYILFQKDNLLRFHREVQTAETATRSQQGTREASTQMSRIAVYHIVDAPQTEKIIIPRKYYTSEELDKEKWQKAIKIQTVVRGWFARRMARELKEEVEQRKKFIAEQENIREQEMKELREIDIERRKNPKSKEDFDLLHRELKAWYERERSIIYQQELSEEETQQELAYLLAKQTQLLQTIDKLKIKAQKETKKEKIYSKLKEVRISASSVLKHQIIPHTHPKQYHSTTTFFFCSDVFL
jgi:hypothetical protein